MISDLCLFFIWVLIFSSLFLLHNVTFCKSYFQESEAGHLCHVWSSQPVLKWGLYCGDLRMSAAVLFSGNNYQKVALMAKYLNMPCMGPVSFHRLQRHYLVPAVEQVWKAEEHVHACSWCYMHQNYWSHSPQTFKPCKYVVFINCAYSHVASCCSL